MTTTELIAHLHEADPDGTSEVSVGNVPVTFVTKEPGYYDGRQQVFIRDDRGQIAGAKYNRDRPKIVIHSLSITERLWDDPDMPVDYSGLSPAQAEQRRAYHDRVRQAVREVEFSIVRDEYVAWVRDRFGSLLEENEDILTSAVTFLVDHPELMQPDPAVTDARLSAKENMQRTWDAKLDVGEQDGYFRVGFKK